MQKLNVPLVLALAIAAALVCGCDSQEPAAMSDMEKLQGTWVGQAVGQDGQVTMTISGNTIEFQGSQPQEWYKGTVVLYEDQSPKQADFTISECPFPDYVGKISKTIYELDGDTCTLAGAEPGAESRPSDFDPSGMNRVFQLTLQPGDTE